MKKALIIIFALLINYNSFGQEEPKIPKYNAKNAAQLFYYSLSETPKKIKVKKTVVKNKTIASLKKYNSKIKQLSFLNMPNLLGLELTINSLGKKIYTDRDVAQEVGQKIIKIVVPVLDSVAVYEKQLNSNLSSFLSKKQLKKWFKYQKEEKRKLKPESLRSNINKSTPIRNRSGRIGGSRNLNLGM